MSIVYPTIKKLKEKLEDSYFFSISPCKSKRKTGDKILDLLI